MQTVRKQQLSTDWKKLYHARAGVEGTLSQVILTLGLRQARYIGLVKVIS
ncbi:transposase [Nostoc sp. LEGE 12447]|nr:transposase [Nostoc sp. LEGE 12447]